MLDPNPWRFVEAHMRQQEDVRARQARVQPVAVEVENEEEIQLDDEEEGGGDMHTDADAEQGHTAAPKEEEEELTDEQKAMKAMMGFSY